MMKFRVGVLSLGVLSALAVAGCGKSNGDTTQTVSSAASRTEVTPAASAAPAAVGSAAAAPTEEVSATVPTSFDGGTKQTIENAVGLGCEARSQSGWLELLCRKKNGTGGRPVKAVFTPVAAADAAAPNQPAAANQPTDGDTADAGEKGEEILADETSGELRFTVPYHAGAAQEVNVEWTDVSYLLKVKDGAAKLDWASSTLELRKACAQLQEESKARLTDAQKPEATNPLLPGEAGKLMRFGVCQPAGRGSWAIALSSIAGKGDKADRRIRTELQLVRISEKGARTSAPLGSFEVPPGGLELGRVQAYDFDDDGRDEAIFSYELKSGPATVEPAAPLAIWTFDDDKVKPYEKAPRPSAGGSFIEQLDSDMRPDIGSQGPFFATLGADCGAKTCPPRIAGPHFFAHSFPDGSFKLDDAAARGALKRSCSKKPDSVVAQGDGGANVARTATNVVCARAWGQPSDSIVTELESKRSALCGDKQSCPLLETLSTWARAEAPVTLSGSDAK